MHSGGNYRGGGGRGGFGNIGGRGQYKHDGMYWLEENAEQFRKLFIGGLSYETTDESLKAHFEQYGKVVDCVVMREPNSHKSRGFGFVTFEKPESVNEAQKARPHTIDSRQVEAKRAMPRDRSEEPGGQNKTKKIHVKHIKKDTTEEEIRELFSKEGEVEKVSIPTKNNQKSDFCFVTFADEDTTDKCVIKKMFDLNGTKLEVNKAIERNQLLDYNMRGPRGGMRQMHGHGGYPPSYDGYGYGGYDDGYGGAGYGYEGDYNDCYNSGHMKGGYSQRGQGHYGGGGYGRGGYNGGGYGGYGRGGGRPY